MVVDGSSVSVAQLLQDVIGKEEHLRPDCGRLREIHARIAKEVQDAKVGAVRPLSGCTSILLRSDGR